MVAGILYKSRDLKFPSLSRGIISFPPLKFIEILNQHSLVCILYSMYLLCVLSDDVLSPFLKKIYIDLNRLILDCKGCFIGEMCTYYKWLCYIKHTWARVFYPHEAIFIL